MKDSKFARANFLDGAALAARELGRRDVPERLERAWRAQASMLRLARWLATAGSGAALRKRAAAALETCPKDANRQRALLHVLARDLAAAAKLLAAARGLGWSSENHPGHLLLPLFQALLTEKDVSASNLRLPESVTDVGEFENVDEFAEEDGTGPQPKLDTPDLRDLMVRAGLQGVTDGAERAALLGAMRKAAERRLAGVTEHKRRRHYDHAAQVVAAVVACDASPETARWVVGLRTTYSRYPALRAALDRRAGGG